MPAVTMPVTKPDCKEVGIPAEGCFTLELVGFLVALF